MERPEIVAIVLAAGLSRRFGDDNKLLTLIDHEALVRRVVRPILEADLPVLTVTGHQAAAIEEALQGLVGVAFVRNERYELGLGASIACGVAASPTASGWLLVPGDMPNLTASTIDRVVRAGCEAGQEALVVCQCGSTLSPPAYFARAYYEALIRLDGDQGAKSILAANRDRVRTIEVPANELKDIDLPMTAK